MGNPNGYSWECGTQLGVLKCAVLGGLCSMLVQNPSVAYLTVLLPHNQFQPPTCFSCESGSSSQDLISVSLFQKTNTPSPRNPAQVFHT